MDGYIPINIFRLILSFEKTLHLTVYNVLILPVTKSVTLFGENKVNPNFTVIIM